LSGCTKRMVFAMSFPPSPSEAELAYMRGSQLLQTLEFAEEIGSYHILKLQLGSFGAELEAHEDEIIREDYLKLLERVEPCFEIERVHGRGSLLNLDHRYIRNGLRRGDSNICEAELEAARRWRAQAQKAL